MIIAGGRWWWLRLCFLAACAVRGPVVAEEPPAVAGVRPPLLSRHAAQTPEGKLLQKWWDEGTAAGNQGDGYLNLDNGHSAFAAVSLPQVAVVKRDEAAKLFADRREDAAGERVIIANSSTRNPRSYMLNLVADPRQAEQYCRRHWRGGGIFVTPSVYDFVADAEGVQGLGDVYAANLPYMVSSQGASGTDKPFVQAFLYTLAAFRPEVKKTLLEEGMVVPALHWCLRHAFKGVATPADYMSWRAHLPVMVGRRDPGPAYDMGYRGLYPRGEWHIDIAEMMTLAHDMTIRGIPPLVQMEVEEDDFSAAPAAGHHDVRHGERLHTTPHAIARIFRGRQFRHRMVVSVADSVSLAGTPLRFHWKLLQGPAGGVKITPLDETGSRAEIEVEHFEPFVIHDGSAIVSSRIDVGVFAQDGEVLSVPGLVSFYAIPFEARTWDEQGRLLEIGWGVGKTSVGCRHAPLTIKGRSQPTVLAEGEARGYAVHSWRRAFRCLAGEGESPAVRLLQERFPPETLTAMQRKAAEFLPLQERFLAALAVARQAGDVKKLEAAVEQAAARLAQKPGEEHEGKLAEARRRLDEARKAAEQTAGKGTDDLEATSSAAAEALAGPDAAIGRSLKDAFEAGLQSIVDDPEWFFTHQDEIAALQKAAAAAQPKRPDGDLAAVLAPFAAVGLIRKEADGRWNLTPMRPGRTLLATPLTAYERFLVARLNACVMSRVVFPDFFDSRFRVNFVDPRLSVLKNWRDVFEYGPDGELAGWTRYEAGARHEFTADGRLVVEKDADGRVVRAEPVVYSDPVINWQGIEKFDTLRVEWKRAGPADAKQ